MIALIFDTETTGLVDNHTLKIDRQPEVIEFFGRIVDLKTGEIIDECEQLIKPERGIPEKVTEITGIDEGMVAQAPYFVGVADALISFIQGAPAIVAHNLSYDMEMMDLEAERLDKAIAWPQERICTVEQTVHLKGFRLNLAGLYEFLFDDEFSDAHRARTDVEALAKCCVELFKRGEI